MELTNLPDVVGIVGSRGPDPERGRLTGWPDNGYFLVMRLMDRISRVRREHHGKAMVVSGGASSGVDRHARLSARNLGWCMGEHLTTDPTSVDCINDHFIEFPALWRGADGKQPLNRRAGFERNDKLVRHCGLVLALFAPGEWTPGTSDVIRRCREYEIPVMIYHEGVWR